VDKAGLEKIDDPAVAIHSDRVDRTAIRSALRLPVYSAFVRTAFLNMLAYRMRYFTGIITYLLFVSVNYFIWQAVYAGSPDTHTINGYTFAEMVTYVSIAWMSRSLYFSSIDNEIDEIVKSGQISVYLIRPVNFHLMMLTQAAGESVFRLVFFTLPISIVILLIFPVSPPASLEHGIMFLLSTFLSFFILAEVNFLVGLSAFYLKSIQGISRAKYFIVQLLSGLLLPIAFFPDWLQSILGFLPFSSIAFLPLQCYLGKTSLGNFPEVILTQLGWGLALATLSHFMWQRAVAKLTLQGG
jgi:ABC-2 type transport system permease protein